MRRQNAALLYGGFWIAAGVSLLHKGSSLLEQAAGDLGLQSILKWLVDLGIHPQEATVICVACALVLGMIKGRTVLTKVAQRHLEYLCIQDEPISWWRAIPSRSLFLVIVMIGLGKLLAWFAPIDARGIVAAAVGMALLIGGIHLIRGRSQFTEITAAKSSHY